MLYGRELVTPLEALLSNHTEATVMDPNQFLLSRIRVMKKARQLVAQMLQNQREDRVAKEQELFGPTSLNNSL